MWASQADRLVKPKPVHGHGRGQLAGHSQGMGLPDGKEAEGGREEVRGEQWEVAEEERGGKGLCASAGAQVAAGQGSEAAIFASEH